MPLLTAIDEYDRTIQTIAAHAEVALHSSDPASHEAALRFIFALCYEGDEIVEGALTGPLPAFLTSVALRLFPG